MFLPFSFSSTLNSHPLPLCETQKNEKLVQISPHNIAAHSLPPLSPPHSYLSFLRPGHEGLLEGHRQRLAHLGILLLARLRAPLARAGSRRRLLVGTLDLPKPSLEGLISRRAERRGGASGYSRLANGFVHVPRDAKKCQ